MASEIDYTEPPTPPLERTGRRLGATNCWLPINREPSKENHP